MEYLWKVVPLSKGQLLDVRPEDILNGGSFRKCDTYRGGGGYDLFPALANKFFNESDHNLQFIVQLFGCNLDCPYCYVTREGVWGKPLTYTTRQLVEFFNESPCSVFHLMGGAPALYLLHWPELLKALEDLGKSGWLFHSDLMLTERNYSELLLETIAHHRSLYAVNIKGVTPKVFEENARKPMNEKLFWKNLHRIQRSSVNHYFTFTNLSEEELYLFWNKFGDMFGFEEMIKMKDISSEIELKNYMAEAYVDEVPWGRNELLPPS